MTVATWAASLIFQNLFPFLAASININPSQRYFFKDIFLEIAARIIEKDLVTSFDVLASDDHRLIYSLVDDSFADNSAIIPFRIYSPLQNSG